MEKPYQVHKISITLKSNVLRPLFLGLSALLSFFPGIFRHDALKEKFQKLACKKGSRYELIGICLGMITDLAQFKKTGYYGQIMEWTRVSVFSHWITECNRCPRLSDYPRYI